MSDYLPDIWLRIQGRSNVFIEQMQKIVESFGNGYTCKLVDLSHDNAVMLDITREAQSQEGSVTGQLSPMRGRRHESEWRYRLHGMIQPMKNMLL
jgi:hypothetical protein